MYVNALFGEAVIVGGEAAGLRPQDFLSVCKQTKHTHFSGAGQPLLGFFPLLKFISRLLSRLGCLARW